MLPRTRYRNTGSAFAFLTRRSDENTDVPSAVKRTLVYFFEIPRPLRVFENTADLERSALNDSLRVLPFRSQVIFFTFCCDPYDGIQNNGRVIEIFLASRTRVDMHGGKNQQYLEEVKTVRVVNRFRWKTYVYPLIYSSRRVNTARKLQFGRFKPSVLFELSAMSYKIFHK